MKNLINCLFAFLLLLSPWPLFSQYTMPIETAEHEGTWLQWPHNYLYGPFYRDDLRVTFVQMTRELIKGENVHIIAYDEVERDYIINLLNSQDIPLDKIDFYLYPTDDCWVRDNGPIFVYDESNALHIVDWGFNGWGNDTPYELCDVIPQTVGNILSMPVLDVSAVVLEGGAFEIDGNGAFMATKSSILGDDRNPDFSQTEIEDYLSTYLGVEKFIWLEGVAGLEITDMHIDGFAKFHDAATIVCMDSLDLLYYDVPPADITTLYNATNVEGQPYEYVYLPLTENNVVTTWGQNLQYKGSYVNYYVANAVVLVPWYNDPNDDVAIGILQDLYPDREVVGVDVRNLYFGGGMVHCVTQQQPVGLDPVAVFHQITRTASLAQNTPNPFNDQTTVIVELKKAGAIRLELFNRQGQLVRTLVEGIFPMGSHEVLISGDDLPDGQYTYVLYLDGQLQASRSLMVLD